MQLNQTDIDFLFAQLTLPGNDPRNAPLGTVNDPTGIRDVAGVGNNVLNPTWGNTSLAFPRVTGNASVPGDVPNLAPAPAPAIDPNASTPNFAQGFTPTNLTPPGSITPRTGVSYPAGNRDITDADARVVSNLVANQDADALAALGYTTPGQQKLAVLDDPSLTPGGRLNPFTGNVNPLPYSTFTTMFGQFFDHGLDFVHKGANGNIRVPLMPSDPLAVRAGLAITGSRTNTIQVDIDVTSTDDLLGTLGLTETRTPGTVTGAVFANVGNNGGVLVLNNTVINIANNSTMAQVVAAINAKSIQTGVTASVGTGLDANKLVLTAPVNESVNTTSPFIDLSQSYGSQASHTVFVREYDTTTPIVNGQGQNPDHANITGALLSGKDGGMATWADVKANAKLIGITLNDMDVHNIPEVLLNTDGTPKIVDGSAWLVARHVVTGEVYYVNNSDAAKASAVLDANERAVTLSDADMSSLHLMTIGAAFLDDIAHGAAPGMVDHDRDPTTPMIAKTADADSVAGGSVASTNYDNELLDAHFIAGDGRANENIGLTAIHDVFHAEHNRVLQDIKAMVLGGVDSHGVTHAARTDMTGQWTGEMFFQAAKLVTEMEYQHLVFGEFVRKLSPNINAFAAYDATINPAVTAEFAHAVYRFGHSMLTEKVNLTDVTTGADKSIDLIEAFLNPLAYSKTTAGEFAIGGSQAVGNGIDVWVTDALRNNLVGLPLDLATLNIVRGRDAGIMTLNQVRADLYNQGVVHLKPYTSWEEFAAGLTHPEALENFIMAYSRDAILTQFASTTAFTTFAASSTLTSLPGTPTDLEKWTALQKSSVQAEYQAYDAALRAAVELAMADPTFMLYDQGFNAVDLWVGGLAERPVTGGMLGSTFDFIFAKQMIELQNADRFYYLNRLAGTNILAEIEAQLFSDLVMRSTGVENLYTDIFSTPDSSVNLDTATTRVFLSLSQLGADGSLGVLDNRVNATDVHGNTVKVSTAGWVGSAATGYTYYGNPGDYLDARGVLNPNGKGNASEIIAGTIKNDRINGLGGNDTIWGKGGHDTIDGGLGNDYLHGEDGDDVITDADGDDLIWGDAGNDRINAGLGLDQVFGGSGADTLYGGAGADVMEGGTGNDLMYGDNGVVNAAGVMDAIGDADLMAGGDGDDILYGGGGDDAIDGGDGDDVIYGGTGLNLLTGGLGNDRFIMEASSEGLGNAMDGGLGYDVVDYSASMGMVPVAGGPRTGISVNLSVPNPAVVAVPFDTFIDVEGLIGTGLNDTLVGGAFIVNTYITDPLTGLPILSGGRLQLDLLASTGASAGFDIADVFGAPVIGTDDLGNPVLVAEDFFIDGGAGNDIVTGGDGNDTLDGGAGRDTLTGGLGDDVYIVDSANDVIIEGWQIDPATGLLAVDPVTGANIPLLVQSTADRVETTLGTYNLSTPALRQFIEDLTYTGVGDFTGTGNTLDNLITGAGGNDNLSGLDGLDTLHGGAGNDTLNGGNGNDLLNGDAGNDSLVGGAGNDQLNGGDGVDRLIGGAGADTLRGGAGADVFVYAAAADTGNTLATRDTIADFESGVDKIDLSAIDARPNNVINTFTWIADAAFSAQGQLRYRVDLGTGQVVVEANTDNNNNTVEFSIALTINSLPPTLLASDFVGVTAGGGNQTQNPAGGQTINGTGGRNTLNGTTLADTINGLGGNDTLNGGLGNDTLSGGAGNDVFVFNTAPSATNLDTITDFSPNVNGNNDTIWLSASVFTGLGANTNVTLNAGAFRQVTTATLGQVDATDRIIYNSTTGALSWDADGSGANFQAVQFAQLDRKSVV